MLLVKKKYLIKAILARSQLKLKALQVSQIIIMHYEKNNKN